MNASTVRFVWLKYRQGRAGFHVRGTLCWGFCWSSGKGGLWSFIPQGRSRWLGGRRCQEQPCTRLPHKSWSWRCGSLQGRCLIQGFFMWRIISQDIGWQVNIQVTIAGSWLYRFFFNVFHVLNQCLGLTLAMLHWIFTSWTNSQLEDYGVDIASTVPNDDGDGVKEWSDLSAACAEVPINAYGAGSDSGTFDFFAEMTLCKDCFAKKANKVPEDFNWCPESASHALENLNTSDAEALKSYMQTQRPTNCYMASEDDYHLVQWLLADTGGISYFGYSYYSQFSSKLTVARIASDREKGVADTADAKARSNIFGLQVSISDMRSVNRNRWNVAHTTLIWSWNRQSGSWGRLLIFLQ